MGSYPMDVPKQDEMERKILQHLSSCGPIYKKELETWMKGENMPKNAGQALYANLVNSGKIARLTEHLSSSVVVGMPDDIAKIRLNAPSGTYR